MLEFVSIARGGQAWVEIQQRKTNLSYISLVPGALSLQHCTVRLRPHDQAKKTNANAASKCIGTVDLQAVCIPAAPLCSVDLR